ncbi:MAG: phosphoribosylamine--glycine ligase [Myxococcales bacterium]|nr:phosphoribosylamine--glycine ligase [Myxococcales bacterium]
MRVMLLGSGGREHALAWCFSKSPQCERLLCLPGNPGIAVLENCTCVEGSAEDLESVLRSVREQRPDLVVVGPEAPLVAGLADRLLDAGVTVLGPTRAGAQLEGSKAFAKEIMRESGIPTAAFESFADAAAARSFLQAHPGRWVVKADGLAAGKGVFPCDGVSEAVAAVSRLMEERAFGVAGARVVIEEYLEGEEASCIALTDGSHVVMLPFSQDHKRALDGDRGPNTGGMGAYSPAPVADEALAQLVRQQVFSPLLSALRRRGIEYRGFLYAGLMITQGAPRVLEFNVRLGDPETQALLPRLESDLLPLVYAAATGTLAGANLACSPRASVCVVLASRGYPGPYEKGLPITGLQSAQALPDTFVFHAGTRRERGQWLTAGGRVLGVTALGDDIPAAVAAAYRAVAAIEFSGKTYRRDIAHRALRR